MRRIDYEGLLKCIKETQKKFPREKSFHIIINEAIMGENPVIFLLYDLMKNAPNTPLKSLSQEQKIEYKDALKVLRFSVLTSEKGFSSTRFWNWEELSSGDTPLQIQKIEFSRYKGKTYITLHVINPFDPKEPGYEGVIIVHNSKANNLLRYLIKEELKLGI